MTIKDLMPWQKRRGSLPVRREGEHSFLSLQKEMNELFESFFRGWHMPSFGDLGDWQEDFTPHIDVKESEKDIHITAELPGMDENDIDVSLTGDALTLKGEKKEERNEKEKNYWHVERRYGAFHRVLPLPEGIDMEKIDATFKRGVLHISIPKKEQIDSSAKKITIKTE